MGWQVGDGMRGRGRGRGGGKGGRGYGGGAGGGAGGGGAERRSTAEQHAFAPRVLDPSLSQYFTGIATRVLDPSLSQYFTEIATAWEDTPDPQDRASIAANALEEARGKEHQLLWDTQTCRTLEPLLSAAPPPAAARFLAGACCCARRRGEAEGEGAGGGGEGSGEREVNVCRDVLAHGLASRVIEAGLRNIRAWVTGESRTRGSAGLDENGAGDDENEEQDGEGEEEEENEEETEGQGDLPKWTETVRVVLKKICKEVTEYPLAAMTSPACSHVLRSLLLLLACRPIHDTPAAAEGTRKARRDGADSVGGEEKREQGGEEAGEERREGGAGRRFGGRLPPQIQRAAGNFPPSSGATFPGLPGMAGQGAGLAGGKEVGAAAGGAEAAAAAERGRRVGAALGFPALLQRVVVGVTAAAAGADEAVPSAAVAWSPYGDSWTLACDPSAGPLLQVLLDVIRDDAALLTHVITSLLHLPEAALRAAAKKRKRAGPGKQEGERGKKRSRREKEEGGEEGDEEEGRGGAEGGEEGEEADHQVEEEVGQIIELMKDRCGSRFMETVIQLAPQSLRSSLLRVALLPHLLPLVLHPIANYTVQTALSALHSPSTPCLPLLSLRSSLLRVALLPHLLPLALHPIANYTVQTALSALHSPSTPCLPLLVFSSSFFSLSPPSAPFPQAVLLLAPQSLRSSLLRVALLPHLLPLALHPIANYTVQTALSALHSPSTPCLPLLSLRSSLLRAALLPHLLPLALHPIANYTVQTALSALHSPSDVKRAFKALAERGTGEGEGEEGGGNRGEEGGEAGGRGEGLLALLKGGRGRVVLALLIACGRTKTFQARVSESCDVWSHFCGSGSGVVGTAEGGQGAGGVGTAHCVRTHQDACDSLLAALSSSPAPSPVDAAAADAAAVGDLLWLDAWQAVRVNDVRSNRAKKRQQQQGWGSVPVTERGAVSFVGCMALQTIFSFPLAASQRVVQACVALPPSYLMHLATDVKGTRVLSAFFRAATVPLDLKTTMLNSLKPRLTTIAADRLGAFVVSAAFDAMTVEGKQMILAELATRYSSASSSLLQRPLFRHMSLAEYLESPEAWQKQQQRKEGLLREFQDLLAPAPAALPSLAPAPAALPSLAPAPPALPSASAPDAKPRKKKREPTVEVAASAVTKNTKSGKKRRGGGEGDEGEEGRHGGSDVGSRGGGKSGEALRGIVEQLELGSELAMLGFSGDGGEMGQDEMDGGSVSKKRKDKSAGAAPKKRGRV
ncbi:unnamed protein product [Closterium sp. Naga37s-1]|nr:unnamed protein product [Closterium sp. Naga37s-1]